MYRLDSSEGEEHLCVRAKKFSRFRDRMQESNACVLRVSGSFYILYTCIVLYRPLGSAKKNTVWRKAEKHSPPRKKQCCLYRGTIVEHVNSVEVL